jgi:hypothetical protein
VKVPMPPNHPGEFLAEILEDTVTAILAEPAGGP